MKGRVKRICAAIAAAMGITLACTMPAAAFSNGEAGQEKTETAETTEKTGPLEEQAPDEAEPTPFSMPGNGKLVDDVEDDGTTKQFLAVQTKNGNTFYIVVDRSGSTENVYMLSLVDENDLAEFMEEPDSGDGQEEDETAEPALDLETSADGEAADGQEEDEKQEESRGMGGIIPVILILGGCAAGLCYYLKAVRPQKKDDIAEEEPVEFYSDYEESAEDTAENEE